MEETINMDVDSVVIFHKYMKLIFDDKSGLTKIILCTIITH